MLLHIPSNVETWMRAAMLGGAELQIVQQRIEPGFRNIAILANIPVPVEITIGVASLVNPEADVVHQRIDASGAHIRVAGEIPLGIEELTQILEEFRIQHEMRASECGTTASYTRRGWFAYGLLCCT